MTGFLSDADLKQLTGYERPADQVRWLKRNGVQHYRQRLNGRPVVTWDAVNRLEAQPLPAPAPRLDWVKARRA